MAIGFPVQSHFNFDRAAVEFIAIVNGCKRRCLVTREALEDHFGADQDSNFGEVFENNRAVIEAVARDLIEQGSTGEILLNSWSF